MLRALPRCPAGASATSQAMTRVMAAELPSPKRSRLTPAAHRVGTVASRMSAMTARTPPDSATVR